MWRLTQLKKASTGSAQAGVLESHFFARFTITGEFTVSTM
jgi:hypothetical protein